MSNLDDLKFDNSFVSEFPGEATVDGNHIYARTTPGVLYAHTPPTSVKNPEILIWSDEAARLLDLENQSDDAPQVFSGNKLLKGMQPFSTRYGGHQFGVWASQLGDGRAISLGEVINNSNERWEIQLKGAGPTPYSRRADGRAVLRSSLREFMCSEAMFHLGIPTTRALCCVTTGEKVVRDMFYDGHPQNEPGAITTRLAPTFLRFGHFEILAENREIELLKKLTFYTIKNHFPGFKFKTEDDIAVWFEEVCKRTAHLMIQWMRVGFVHGVMNTDNMSILGLTIDYGPYGWLDVFDSEWTPNTTDAGKKRYRYSQQPAIGIWNLSKLGNALTLIVKDKTKLEKCLETYQEIFTQEYPKMRANKLGLQNLNDPDDFKLVQELDLILQTQETDMTIFYRNLSEVSNLQQFEKIEQSYYAQNPGGKPVVAMQIWLTRYFQRLAKEKSSPQEIKTLMNKNNPYFILRNYLVQEALDALEKNDRSVMDSLMLALKTPYEKNKNTQKYFTKRPEWARSRPGCSDLSCSS